MKRERILLLLSVLIGMGLLPFIALQLVPERSIEEAVKRLLAQQGLTLNIRKLVVSFPAVVTITDLTLGNDSKSFLKFDRLRLRLHVTPLLLGRLSCAVDGTIGTRGTVTGRLTIAPRLEGNLQAKEISLASIPALTATLGPGISGSSTIDLSLSSTEAHGTSGDLKLQIRDLQLRNSHISSLPLPDVVFPDVRGLAKLKGQTVVIDNLALQGKGIYLRLNGSVILTQQAPLNLQLELLPDADLLATQKSVFLLMLPYQVSPGSYRLPIIGSLSHPQLGSR